MRILLVDAYRCLGWRIIALFILLILSGLFEGLGLAMLFPLLTRFGIGAVADGDVLQGYIDRVLSFFGLSSQLGPILIVMVGVLYLQIAMQIAKSWIEADCQTRYTEQWHRKLFRSFMHSRWSFFVAENTSTRINAIMTEAGRISAAFFMLVQVATSLVFMLVYVTISLASSWQMVAILGGFGVFVYWILRPLNRRSQKIGERVSVVSETLQHRTIEFINNAKLIKATATENLSESIFGDASMHFRLAYREAGFHPKMIYGIYMLAGYALLGLGLWSCIEILQLNPATVLVSVYIFLRLYVQFTNLQQYRQGYILSAPAFKVAMSQIEAAQNAVERLNEGTPLPQGPAQLSFSNLSVCYGEKQALNRVSLNISSGDLIGITGQSGAGKSTLVDVVVGLVQPSNGVLEIDGISIGEVALQDWRRSIGYVGQETLLLNGSIASNIAWGNDFSQLEIERAAMLANAHEFISNLPNGYATQVGDRGIRLSGGQRQRLGLARALMGKKRLLILDEATSALDSQSEREIMVALSAIRGDMTILMIAHRLSTLYEADAILVFDNGRLIESGQWDDLIKLDGSFSKLWRLQQSSSRVGI